MGKETSSASSACLVFLLLLLLVLALNNTPALGREAGAEKMFFVLEDLKPGATMELYFPTPMSSIYPAPHPDFISRDEAESIPIPFSSDHLPDLLHFFSVPRGSAQAQRMKETLGLCGAPAINGEIKTCATSRESMRDFVHRALTPLGADDSILGVGTRRYYKGDGPVVPLQNYTVVGRPRELLARPDQSLVGCHLLYYPYKVFSCHSLPGENKAFLVDLVGVDTGDRVVAAAACHLGIGQTTHVRGVDSGFTDGICHIFPQDDVLFVPRRGRHAVADRVAAA